MNLPPIEFSDESGATVISLTLARERRGLFSFPGDKICHHRHVTVDTSLAELKCDDCGERLNAVEWIANNIENWRYIRDMYEEQKRAAARYEAKRRTRCEHCSKLTRVNPPTNAEVRAFDRTKAEKP
jgi:hypothetical protein